MSDAAAAHVFLRRVPCPPWFKGNPQGKPTILDPAYFDAYPRPFPQNGPFDSLSGMLLLRCVGVR